jgi:hypothetical protein
VDVGEDAEGCAWHLLGRLNDLPAELFGFRQGCGHVFDADKEEDLVFRALSRADRHKYGPPSAPVSMKV